MKIVVVSPHRDDAAFSLGLSIQRWLDAGHAVSVLNCFTRSQYAPYSDVEALHTNDRTSFVSALRRREDVAWARRYQGTISFHDLDLLDAPLRLACAVDEVLSAEIRAGDRAVARVAGAIAKIVRKAGAVAVIGPLAVGGHVDHRVVRQAVLQTVDQNAVPLALYEDLPYAAREGAAAELPMMASELLAEPVSCFAAQPWMGQDAAQALKMRFAECYDSQIDSEVAASIASFCSRYAGRERLWANAAFLECALGVGGEEGAE